MLRRKHDLPCLESHGGEYPRRRSVQENGWTDLKEIHAHQRFVVLHELLHISVMLSYPKFSHDDQEDAVRETSVMIIDEPEKR
jgi:hypothetical protein